ncbi:uncharacterized protein LOC127849748 [Dreissena polymorpha]|uniref:uncharacterized protein LOC127849748 n=1 Tax=Dreissena polymorpha TaxID=45954 RepID=UPI0022645147|nr:uncharacterized protein LOC127849748 [Dreissena polymorpha]
MSFITKPCRSTLGMMECTSLKHGAMNSSPRLYCITLEVKDVAYNIRQTRRFMLYDNSSVIKTWNENRTYTFNIRPVDIADNTFNESRTVYIDRSPPHLTNIWLMKDGYEMLYVHNSTDLSKMQMTFDALDPHSGLQMISWEFGIADTTTVLIGGNIGVVEAKNAKCPADTVDCYCPDIGMCAFVNYSIPLNELVHAHTHIGNHNRKYFFTITITNNALLTTKERMDVLVDKSPPEEGVIYEGPLDYKDIDYTSEDSFVIHWHGFIDHESGIKLYRLGLAARCLTNNELYNFTEVTEIMVYKELTETSVRFPANFTGKRFVTIIALNHAMESSKPVCSDGITRDTSAPLIRNLTIGHAAWTETVEESGSQIDDFYVGLGLDTTELNAPRLVDYISTDRNTYFRHRHEAIGSEELLYVFIKTVNKAGLSNIVTLGPILIDQTPPHSISNNSIYFFLVKATCSDGSTTSASNGVRFCFRFPILDSIIHYFTILN